jgi:hypothetical protein
MLLVSGCASVQVNTENLPPVLTQSEIFRPYHKVADVQVSRERYGAITDISPEDYQWAYKALEIEAKRIGADAVILPEIKVELDNYIMFPSSHINARGVAIKFD